MYNLNHLRQKSAILCFKDFVKNEYYTWKFGGFFAFFYELLKSISVIGYHGVTYYYQLFVLCTLFLCITINYSRSVLHFCKILKVCG